MKKNVRTVETFKVDKFNLIPVLGVNFGFFKRFYNLHPSKQVQYFSYDFVINKSELRAILPCTYLALAVTLKAADSHA